MWNSARSELKTKLGWVAILVSSSDWSTQKFVKVPWRIVHNNRDRINTCNSNSIDILNQKEVHTCRSRVTSLVDHNSIHFWLCKVAWSPLIIFVLYHTKDLLIMDYKVIIFPSWIYISFWRLNPSVCWQQLRGCFLLWLNARGWCERYKVHPI